MQNTFIIVLFIGAVQAAATTVITLPATNITTSSAEIRGSVNPGGVPTFASFEYGTTTNYMSRTSSTYVGNGTTNVVLSWPLSALDASMTYYFRIQALSSAGQPVGSNLSFQTLAIPEPTDLALGPPVEFQNALIGEPISIPINVTNQSGSIGEDVNLRISFPSGWEFTNAELSQGFYQLSMTNLTCSLGNLDAHSQATALLHFQPNQAGWFDVAATVSLSSEETTTDNNSLLFGYMIGLGEWSSAPHWLAMPLVDLMTGPQRETVYVSVGGDNQLIANQVIELDPLSGQITTSYLQGAGPTRLAISPDGQYLYALHGSGHMITRIHLQSQTEDLTFPIGEGSPGRELVVDPGNPLRLAVLYEDRSFVVYDDGQALNGVGVNVTDVVFLEDAPELVVINGGIPRAIQRWSVDEEAIRVMEGLRIHVSGNLAVASNLLYYGSSHVMDARNLHVLRTLPFSVMVLPQQDVHRLFQISRDPLNASNPFYLEAFDLHGTIKTGSIILTSPKVPALTRLLRWGKAGLAIASVGERFGLVKGTLFPTGANADVAVTVAPNSRQPVIGEVLTQQVTITNTGPNPALNVVATLAIPPALEYVGAESDQLDLRFENGAVLGRATNVLDVSDAKVFRVTTQVRSLGNVDVLASVLSQQEDAQPWNNQFRDRYITQKQLYGIRIRRLPVKVSGMVWNEQDQQFYLSMPGGSPVVPYNLTSYDPSQDVFSPGLIVGPNPGSLALHENGQVLYVSTHGGKRFEGIDLVANQQFLNAPVDTIPDNPRPRTIQDWEVMRGDSRSLVISRLGNPSDNLVIMDHGVPRAGSELQVHPQIELGDGPYGTSLFALQNASLQRWIISSNAVVFDQQVDGLVHWDIRYDQGLLFDLDGTIIDGHTMSQRSQIEGVVVPNVDGTILSVAPWVEAGHVFYLQPGFVVEVFDLESGLRLRSIEEPDPEGWGSLFDFQHWGPSGVAFRTPNSVYLMEGLAPTDPPTDLALSVIANPGSHFMGATQTWNLSITNQGPNTARHVAIAFDVPNDLQLLETIFEQGSCVLRGSKVTCHMDSLSPGEGGAVYVRVQAVGDASITNGFALSSAALESDSSNNFFWLISSSLVRREYIWDPIPKPVFAGLPTPASLYVFGDQGLLDTNYNGTMSLDVMGLANAMNLEVSPASVSVIEGNWQGYFTVAGTGTNLVLRVETDQGQGGSSSTFDALPWQDLDMDGLPDEWETMFFEGIETPEADPNRDPDEDGLTNREEFERRTNPIVSEVTIRHIEVRWQEGKIELRFGTIPGRHYQVESTEYLGAEWLGIGNVINANGTTYHLALPLSTEISSGFFRIKEVAP